LTIKILLTILTILAILTLFHKQPTTILKLASTSLVFYEIYFFVREFSEFGKALSQPNWSECFYSSTAQQYIQQQLCQNCTEFRVCGKYIFLQK
jgi:hypothetical protein